MKENNQPMAPGIYLVIDPSMDEKALLDKLDRVLNERISAIQIWENFRKNQPIKRLIREICDRCLAKRVPVFINNKWEYLMDMALSGVHFDHIPNDFEGIKAKVNKPFLCGLTCNNDLSPVRWAATHQLDYISFCSMFPSTTANSCELVNFDTVREAKQIFPNPIFLAGGIKPENIKKLVGIDYHGIAVVSGIMNAENPIESIHQYDQQLNARE